MPHASGFHRPSAPRPTLVAVFAMLACLLGLAGCGGGGGGSSTGGPSAGHLVLSYNGVTPADPNGRVDIGTVPTTSTFTFVLRNTGGTAVDAIALTTGDLSTFVPSPASVASLAPGASANITVTVINGSSADGTTSAPTLSTDPPPAGGPFVFTLGADSPTVDTSLNVEYQPQVAKFAVTWLGASVPLSVPTTTGSFTTSNGTVDTSVFDGYFSGSVPSPSTAFAISNTGNVPVTVRTWVFNSVSAVYEIQSAVAIAPDGTWTAILSDTDSGTGYPVMRFSVDSAGVVFNTSTISPPDDTGIWYGILRAFVAPPG